MNRLLFPLLTLSSFLLFALPAAGFECTNSGAGGPADDNNFVGNTACGTATASGDFSTVVGASATSAGVQSTALGASATSGGNDSVALGAQANSGGILSTAVGRLAVSSGQQSLAVGSSASAGDSGVSLGAEANAIVGEGTAVGAFATAGGFAATAVGHGAEANSFRGTAVGRSASVVGMFSTAVGAGAAAAESSAALGESADAVALQATAVGWVANARIYGTAVGAEAGAFGIGGSALGHYSSAGGDIATALGRYSFASGDGSVALGADANAGGANSLALGWRAGAPNDNTMVLGQIPGVNGGSAYVSVANGTTDPLAPLHIFRDDGTQEFMFLESDEAATTQDRAMMFLANNGGIRFEFANNSLATSWRFQAATGNQDRFEVTKVGTGQIEFWIDDLGNGFIAGDLDVGGNLLTNVLLPSDRNLKTRIETIDPATVLDRVAALPLASWEYTDRPGERHIGPMAQDFQAAFGLGRNDSSISVVDASGVALASIQALEKRNRELEKEVRALEDLRTKNAELEERLALVEALVTQMLPRTAKN